MKLKKIKNIRIIDAGSNPDVDSDLHTEGRKHLIQYVINKYGNDNVASIITPGPFKNKNAWKSMCTIHEIPFIEANEISKLIPDDTNEFPLSKLLSEEMNNDISANLKNALVSDELKESAQSASKLNGRMRETGVHPCGIIISSHKLDEVLPLQTRQDDNLTITQWRYQDCESLGLIKMDFLGLDTIDLIMNTVRNIKYTKGIDLDMNEIVNGNLDDEKTFELFQRGDTEAIFQFASSGVQELLKKVKPTTIEDLAAITALYRPGPMGLNLHLDYAERKQNESARVPVHKAFYGTELEKILEPTLGSLVFQESVMQIASRCAGFSSRETDDLRKAIAKKKLSMLNELEPKFKNGIIKNGYEPNAVEYLWQGILGFGAYAFNKCLKYDTNLNVYYGTDENDKPIFEEMSVEEMYQHDDWEFWVKSFGTDGGYIINKVEYIDYMGKQDVYKITTKSGKQLSITENHRMLTDSGYRSMGFPKENPLQVGDKIVLESDYETEYYSTYYDENSSRPIKDIIDSISMQYANFEYDEIVSIEYDGNVDTYDVVMADAPYNYIANGLVSHNSHSFSYALNSYQAAYLKAHYPVEFMAAVIQQRIKDQNVSIFMSEARRMGIKLQPPSVNQSGFSIMPSKNGEYIVYGLSSIARMSETTSQKIIDERNKNGEYTDIMDFVMRNSDCVKQGTLKQFAQAGALDCFGIPRKQIYDNAQRIIDVANKLKEKKKTTNMFDLFGGPSLQESAIKFTDEEWAFPIYAKNEATVNKMYISCHPIDNIKQEEIDLNAERVEGAVYLTFPIIEVKKNRDGTVQYIVTANNKVSEKTFRISKTLMARFTKHRALEANNGDEMAAAKALKITADKMNTFLGTVPLAPLVEDEVYKVIFETRTFKTKAGGEEVKTLIKDIEKPVLTDSGKIAIEIKMNNKKNIQKYIQFLKSEKGDDVVRLIFPDGDKFDIDNIKFMRGTTIYDLEKIERES